MLELELLILKSNRPTTVKVITEYPNYYEEVSIAELEKQCNFKWLEGLICPEDFIQKCKFLLDLDVFARKFSEHLTNSYLNDLALYKINEEIGYVVVYVGEKSIPANTLLTFYAGQLCDLEERGDGSYASPFHQINATYPREDEDLIKKTSCVDAKNVGNISRFMPDLIDPTEFDKYEFVPGFKKQLIMTANLHVTIFNHPMLTVRTFQSSREIKKGDFVGYTYDLDNAYWFTQELTGISRKLFSTDGKILDFGYRRKEIAVHFMLNGIERWSQFHVRDIYASIEKNQPLYVDYKGKPYQLTQQDKQDALERNGYSPVPLFSVNKIIENGIAVNNTQQILLERYIHPNFKCYLRNDNSAVCDAVVSLHNKTEVEQVAKKLGAHGIFPRVEHSNRSNRVIIDGVNTMASQDQIKAIRSESRQNSPV